MASDTVELIEKQAEIIRLQGEVILNLFTLLLQHISADEANEISCKLNSSAELLTQIK